MNVDPIPVLKPLIQALLPRHLLDDLSKDSQISITGQSTHYEDSAYRQLRGLLWDRVQKLDPNRVQALIIPMGKGPSSKAFRWAKAAGRNPLHYAAALGDVIVAYELLFIGTSPTYPDKTGLTPLYYALLSAAHSRVPTAILRISADNLKPLHEMITELGPSEKFSANLSRICVLLIEQHADVNESHYGNSVLQLACIAQDWKVVALLLQHGARNTIAKTNHSALSWDPDASKRFEALVAEHTLASGAARPPRICPCWSGKLLKDCHQKQDATIIMVDSLPCVCGKHERKYGNCCKKHKISVLEVWDASQNGISRNTSNLEDSVGNTRYATLIRIARYKMQHCFDDEPMPSVVTGNEPDVHIPWPTKKTKLLAERLLSEGKIDPAFAHLMLTTRPPLPMNRGLNIRTQMEGAIEQWNTRLERYIKMKTDSRPEETIRRAVKLGPWGGAFYATCNNPGCGKVNAINGVQLKKCSRCHIAQYCSGNCQTAHWKQHKLKCNNPEQHQTPEYLPSQRAFDDEIAKIMNAIPEFQEAMRLGPPAGA